MVFNGCGILVSIALAVENQSQRFLIHSKGNVIMKNTIKKQAKHISLDNFVSGRFLTKDGWKSIDAKLDGDDIGQIMSIVGNRCHVRTKQRIMAALCNVRNIDSHGILQRMQYSHERGWEYCAGQSYPDEIRTVRKCLIKNF